MPKITSIIVPELYPIVSSAISKNQTKYINFLSKFFQARSADIYDTIPQARILFTAEDTNNYFLALNINPKDVESILSKTYYWDMNFNPRCMKVPLVPTQMMVIRHFLKHNDRKRAEISSIYLAFSGNFYPSIHSQKFIYPPKRHILEYVVNNVLSQKFDLKREGTVFGAIKSICRTWLDTYEKKLCNDDADDEDIADIVQQLHGRIKSFLGNIVAVFKDVYQNSDAYLSYDSDSYEQDNFRLAENDSIKAEGYVENAMNKITTHGVDLSICKKCKDANVKTDEIKSIIEGIQDDPQNLMEVKELLRIMVSEYMANSENKSVTGLEFIAKSITPKPNTKNPNIIREKEIIEKWLDENSPNYRKRKSRLATKISYFKSLLKYYALTISLANK